MTKSNSTGIFVADSPKLTTPPLLRIENVKERYGPTVDRRGGRNFFPNGTGVERLSNCTQAQNAAFATCKSASREYFLAVTRSLRNQIEAAGSNATLVAQLKKTFWCTVFANGVRRQGVCVRPCRKNSKYGGQDESVQLCLSGVSSITEEAYPGFNGIASLQEIYQNESCPAIPSATLCSTLVSQGADAALMAFEASLVGSTASGLNSGLVLMGSLLIATYMGLN